MAYARVNQLKHHINEIISSHNKSLPFFLYDLLLFVRHTANIWYIRMKWNITLYKIKKIMLKNNKMNIFNKDRYGKI